MNRHLAVRSIMETPILDEHKWAKVPSIPADAWILDMEDSVPPARKEEARTKVVEYLGRPEHFNNRLLLPRPNHISTPWGRDDLQALADARVSVIMLPKVESVDDIREVQSILHAGGCDPEIYVNVEAAKGVVNVEAIAQLDEVVCLMWGPGDLSLDVGMPLYDPDGNLNAGFVYPQMRIVLAGAAYGVATTNFVLQPDMRDLAEFRRRTERGRRLGFTSASTFYPPHVDIINEVFSPSPEEIAHARETVEIIDRARAEGAPAALRPDGGVVLVHDYEKARKILARAELLGVAAG
jgi:citrate lyase beta subunit